MGKDVRMEISLQNINKSYGKKVIFQDFSITFPEHSITVLMGASGRGKTTLLHLILEVIKPDKGIIKGNKIKKSAVFQEDRLCMNLSAVANIRLPNPRLGKEEVEKEMEKMGLRDCFHQPVREFSGGMKRRVAILRALLSEAELMILDEPFQGLDDKTKEEVMYYMKEKLVGKTVIMVTHDKKEAEALGEEIRIVYL